MAGYISLWNSNVMGCDLVAMLLVEVVMCWGFMVLVLLCLCCNVLKFWLFVTCVAGRVLWWFCGVGRCGFGHLIFIFCIVHKCGFALLMSMGSLGD